jgi:hypothetical protein
MNWFIWLLSSIFLILYIFKDYKRVAGFGSLILTLLFGIVLFNIPIEESEMMGVSKSGATWTDIFVLMISMILGMISQYFFFMEKEDSFNFHSFIKPFLASPIIFMPLAASQAQSSINLTGSFDLAGFTGIVVAFQNGFFWKIVFDNISKKVAKI